MAKGVKFNIHALDKTGRAFQSVKGKLGELNKQTGGLKNSFGGLGAGIAAAFSTAVVKKIADMGDEINKLSIRLGVAEEQLSALKFAGEQTGVNFQTLSMGLQRMTRRVAEAVQGTGEAVKALDELGISAEELNDLSPDQQFRVLAEAMQGVENQSDKVRLAMKLFDSEGVALLQTMEGGAAAVDKLTKEAEELGATISGPQAQALADMNDSLNRLQNAIMGAATDLVAALAPAIGFVADAFTEFFKLLQMGDDLLTELGVGFVYIAESLGFVEEGLADLAAQEAFDRQKKKAGDLNKELSKTDKLLQKINTREKVAGGVSRTESAKTTKSKKDDLKDLEKQTASTADVIEQELKGALKNLEFDFSNLGDLATSVLKSIGDKLLSSQIDQVFDMFGSGAASGTGGGGGFGNIIGAATSLFDSFGGFFAEGGTLRPGQWGIAGENGPEPIFAGNSPLNVTPAGAGGNNVVVNMNIATPDARSFRESQGQISAKAAMAIRNAQRDL